MRVELNLGDNVQHELCYLGSYSRELVSFLLSELRHDDTFVDVGAHVGTFSLPAARKLTAGRVVAFEPAPDTANVLRETARRNGLASLTVIQAALGDRPASAQLRAAPGFGEDDAGVRSLYGDGGEIFDVPVVRLDDWADENGLRRLDAVKVDVEGSEVAALRGMLGCLSRYRPRILVIEVIRDLLDRARTSPEELERLLTEAAYVPVGPSVASVAARLNPADPFFPNVVLRPASATPC